MSAEIDLSKIFGSKCRAKILEKFFLTHYSHSGEGFHMRGLARDLDEQINSIKRELDNLEKLGVVKYRNELRKKIFFLNPHFPFLNEFQDIFLKNYNPIPLVKNFFRKQSLLDVVIINNSLEKKLQDEGKAILDIFMIGEIDRDILANFLQSVFFERKIKYAIITTEDFFSRINYGDKLIHNILREKGNIFIKDSINIKQKLN